MQKPSVGTIHLVLGLILVSINVFFIFILAIVELGDIGQTVTYNTTFGDAIFAIVMDVLIFLVLPALGGFEIGRWVQARKRALQFSAEATPTIDRAAGEAPAKSEMGVETRVNEQVKKGGMGLSIASIILGLVGFFVIAGEFFGIFGAVLGYYGAKEGSKLGYVGIVFGVIVFLLSLISDFL